MTLQQALSRGRQTYNSSNSEPRLTKSLTLVVVLPTCMSSEFAEATAESYAADNCVNLSGAIAPGITTKPKSFRLWTAFAESSQSALIVLNQSSIQEASNFELDRIKFR